MNKEILKNYTASKYFKIFFAAVPCKNQCNTFYIFMYIYTFSRKQDYVMYMSYGLVGGGGIVRYHDDGSKKLNACILFLSHMVYL